MGMGVEVGRTQAWARRVGGEWGHGCAGGQDTGEDLGMSKELGRMCEGNTTPITLIPISGAIPGDGNHNNRDTLQYKSTG